MKCHMRMLLLMLLILTALLCQPFSLCRPQQARFQALFLKMADWSVYQVHRKKLNKMCIYNSFDK